MPTKKPVLRAPAGYTKLNTKIGDQYPVYLREDNDELPFAVLVGELKDGERTRIAYGDDFKYFKSLADAEEWYNGLDHRQDVTEGFSIGGYAGEARYGGMKSHIVKVTWNMARGRWIEIEPVKGRGHNTQSLKVCTPEAMQAGQEIIDRYQELAKQLNTIEVEWRTFVQSLPILPVPGETK